MEQHGGKNCRITITAPPATGGSPEENYTLKVDSGSIRIVGGGPVGAVWGVQSLLHLFGPAAAAPVEIKQTISANPVDITDEPRFAWRGLLLDPVRNFWPVDEVESLIDSMSSLKMNVLHMHLTDDQAWRIDITGQDTEHGINFSDLIKYSGNGATAEKLTRFTDQVGRAGWYSQNDYRRIVDYAARHGIRVVPEVDGPGHANAALHAIEALNGEKSYLPPDPETGRAPQYGNYTEKFTTLDPDLEATYAFHKTVISQLTELSDTPTTRKMGLTPDFFHIGGDENNSISDADYAHYMGRIDEIAKNNNLTPIYWGDAAGKNIHLPHAVIQPWAQGSRAHAVATKALTVEPTLKLLASPAEYVYFPTRPVVSQQGENIVGPVYGRCGDAPACGTKHYFDWDPGKLYKVDDDRILGVEGALWAETTRNRGDMEFLLFPRMASTADVGWAAAGNRGWDSFAAALANHVQLLLLHGKNFAIDPEAPAGTYAGVFYPAPDPMLAATDSAHRVLLGYLATTAVTDPDQIHLTATAISRSTGDTTTVPLSYRMDETFHATDKDQATGRRMNSLIHVYGDFTAVSDPDITISVGGTAPYFTADAPKELSWRLRTPPADPAPVAPLTGREGEKLSAVAIPATPGGVWSWDKPDTILVRGDNQVLATFTPDDTNTYSPVTRVLLVKVDEQAPAKTSQPDRRSDTDNGSTPLSSPIPVIIALLLALAGAFAAAMPYLRLPQ